MILIVDDNMQILELQVAILESSGYSVRAAESGEVALQMIEEQCPDLILMDITMPGLTGYQVLKQLREKYGEDLAVVLVSALPADEEAEKAIARGASGYISKPFDVESMLKCVKQYLPDTVTA